MAGGSLDGVGRVGVGGIGGVVWQRGMGVGRGGEGVRWGGGGWGGRGEGGRGSVACQPMAPAAVLQIDDGGGCLSQRPAHDPGRGQ